MAKTAGRAEYLAKLRHALSGLEVAAADLGEKHARKKRSVDAKKYDEAAGLKKEIDGDRESTYKKFRVRESIYIAVEFRGLLHKIVRFETYLPVGTFPRGWYV